MKKEPLFKLGEVVFDKSTPEIPIVIREIKKNFFNRPYKYGVGWYNGRDFHTGTAVEHEMSKR